MAPSSARRSRRCAKPMAACRRPARPRPHRSTPSSRRSARPSCSPTRRSRPCACAPAASRSTPKAARRCPGVWAGGDCTFGGQDLTVEAVEHGKIAAHSIDRALAASRGHVASRRLLQPRPAHRSLIHRAPPWPTFAAPSPASRARIRSGSRRRRRPTRNTTSCAPSRRAGAAWSGRRSARRGRRSSTSTGRATPRSIRRTGA